MTPSLRTIVLVVVAATSMAPLVALAWYEATDVASHADALAAAERENAALAAATRAEAAALAGDAWTGLPPDAYLVAADGTWRMEDGSTGQDPALAATISDTLSGTARGRDPLGGEARELAWARIPSLSEAVLLASEPAPAPAVATLLAGVALPLAFGAGLVAVVVTYRVVRPLGRLQAASADLAAGDWSRPVPEDGSAETRALAKAFNAMAEDLLRQRRALETYASETRGDVAAVNFAVAHELREPLRSMRTLAAAVEEDDDGEEAKRALAVIRDRLTFLERVVLDLLRYDSLAQASPSATAVDLGAVVDEAAAATHVEVEREVLPVTQADASLLKEAVVEVMRNVAEHGGGRVRVTGRVEDGKTVVDFDDDGQGLPPGRQDDAFHLFQRFRPDAPGTGVGLAIVRRIASMHGGDARLETAPGGGTRLEIELDARGPPPRPSLAGRAARTF